MHSITIDKSLYEDIKDFCELNQITDFDGFITETLKKGFDMKKYGDTFALFFHKTEEDIVHLKPEPIDNVLVDQNKVVESLIEPEIIPKKRGRKKKESTKPQEVIQKEEPKEPIYKIKEEEIKKPEKKYVSLTTKKDDNYDVYDEL